MGPYVAAKSAVMRATESASAELKEHDINVNAVLPSVLDTPDNRSAMPDADWSKWVSLEQLAAVIGFLVSSDSDAIHGALIPVTGKS
jgi:NAD(P)-dependent dehydrogenase (short-subunit alcohol dehydrogenase family)